MGIGAALSHEAARRGLDVVLLARGREQLEATAAESPSSTVCEVRTIAADLASPDIGEVVADATSDLEVGLVVYNAAVGPNSRFVDGRPRPPPAEHRRELPHTGHAVPPLRPSDGRARPRWHRDDQLDGRDAGRGELRHLQRGQGVRVDPRRDPLDRARRPRRRRAQRLRRGHLVAQLRRVQGDARPRALRSDGHRRPARPSPFAAHAAEPARGGGRPRPTTTWARARCAYAHPDDEWVSRTCFASSRDDAIRVWRALQETSTRRPDRIAR